MFSLWKTCVQNGVKVTQNLVGSLPQFPRSLFINKSTRKVIPSRFALTRRVTPPQITYLSTVKYRFLTDRISGFYPSSTAPITITTTYI